MDAHKIIVFIFVVFCFHLSNSAPIFNGWTQNINASSEYETDVQTGIFVISSNETYANVIRNNLTATPPIQHGKSTFKKIVSKVKSWKGKITGGGGGNKGGKYVKDGGNKGGISVYRPYRPYRPGTFSGSSSTNMIYYVVGIAGSCIVVVICIAVLMYYCKDEKNLNVKQGEKVGGKNLQLMN